MATRKKATPKPPESEVPGGAPPQEDPKSDAPKGEEDDKPTKKVKLVKMVRDDEMDGKRVPPPYTAEVHPDEVSSYVDGGWRQVN